MKTVSELSISLGRLKLANPVMAASGTFGCGREYQDLAGLKHLGAIVTKTITLDPREGNKPARISETYQGMLNAIGLENPGVESFINEQMPFLEQTGIPVIVSISGQDAGEFALLARRLSEVGGISALELNISCPNLGRKGSLIGQDARAAYRVVKAVRKATDLIVVTKLSPNVTDITVIARAAEDAGSDILSLVNTFFGLAVDIKTRRPKLGNVSGGLSGPAIKPQALWMLMQTARAVKLPLIGMGGIMNAQDALEFILCGASAVAVGTANFVNPRAAVQIIDGIKTYLKKNKISSIKKLVKAIR